LNPGACGTARAFAGGRGGACGGPELAPLTCLRVIPGMGGGGGTSRDGVSRVGGGGGIGPREGGAGGSEGALLCGGKGGGSMCCLGSLSCMGSFGGLGGGGGPRFVAAELARDLFAGTSVPTSFPASAIGGGTLNRC
jgi:hypothetical protein